MNRELLIKQLSKLTNAELLERLVNHLVDEHERETVEQQAFEAANQPDNVERFGKFLNKERGSVVGGETHNSIFREGEKRAYKVYLTRLPFKHGEKGKFDQEMALALNVEPKTVASWRERWQRGEVPE